jgi:hypothetical protein
MEAKFNIKKKLSSIETIDKIGTIIKNRDTDYSDNFAEKIIQLQNETSISLSKFYKHLFEAILY